MNKKFKSYFYLLFSLFFLGCASSTPYQVENIMPKDNGLMSEYFITTMISYDDTQQPYLQMYEVNEKDAFIELIRQILDNPDYVFSYFQNDLYYVSQMYNAFSMAEFSTRGGGKFEPINSSGTQTTFRNVETGRLEEIRTYLQRGRYSEIIKYLLDAGYYIHTETFDNSQTILLKDYRNISSSSVNLPFYFTEPIIQTNINFGYDLYYLGYRPNSEEFSNVISNYFKDVIAPSETLLPWSYYLSENNMVLDSRVKTFMRINNLTVCTTFDLNEFGGFTYVINFSFDNHRTFGLIRMDSEGYN